jgi:hypothetical protein
VEVPEYTPEDWLELYEALDLVGTAMFGRRWRGVERYNLEYDRRIESNLKNVREAQRRAVKKYLPCREATKRLRYFLHGDVPDHRNAVPAVFLASTGEMMPIKAHVWGADDTLKIFRIGRIKYNSWNNDFIPLSTREAAGIIEGRIIISRRDLESRLGSASKPPRARTAPKLEAATRALKHFRDRGEEPKEASKQVLAKFNDWLKAQGLPQISDDTLRRAMVRK